MELKYGYENSIVKLEAKGLILDQALVIISIENQSNQQRGRGDEELNEELHA